ncbi:hypothetical protein HDU96_005516, partial [Phlyctochytrium bullatum]
MCKHQVFWKLVFERPQCEMKLNPRLGELSWRDMVALAKRAGQKADCVPIGSNETLYLLYTSGSTGTPKGVVREAGGNIVALKWAMQNIFGVDPGDVFFAASDIGWVVGHSFIVYGPLTHGCTTVLYEGKPVMPGTGAAAFWRLIQEYGIKSMQTAPTAMRAIKREDPKCDLMKVYNLSSLKNIYLVGELYPKQSSQNIKLTDAPLPSPSPGERCDPDTAHFFSRHLGVPLRDNFWQTETGWPITVACTFKHPQDATVPILGSAGPPVPGYD